MKIEMPEVVAEGLGKFLTGLGWLAVWIGFGSCCYLGNRDSGKPAVEIKESFNLKPQ